VKGIRRKIVALAVLAALLTAAWFTMEAGNVRWLVMIVLAGFALRVALTPASRYDGEAR
jgi:hypothetical protein